MGIHTPNLRRRLPFFHIFDKSSNLSKKNQLSRRNLTPFQKAELALKSKPVIEAKAKENLSKSGGDRKSDDYKSGSMNSSNPIETTDTRAELSKLAGVSEQTISRAETAIEKAPDDIDKQIRADRKETIFNMWLACHTQQEIADKVGLAKDSIPRLIEDCCKLESFPKTDKNYAEFSDFMPEIYNIWRLVILETFKGRRDFSRL